MGGIPARTATHELGSQTAGSDPPMRLLGTSRFSSQRFSEFIFLAGKKASLDEVCSGSSQRAVATGKVEGLSRRAMASIYWTKRVDEKS